MRKIIGVAVLIVILAGGCFWQRNAGIDEPRKKEAESVSSAMLKPKIPGPVERSDRFVEKKNQFAYHNQKMQYMIIFPAEYTKTSNQWPLILFLHGSSLRGQNLDLVKSYGPTWVAEQRSDFPFVVLAPQCPENENWLNKAELLTGLLDEVFEKYRIDRNRVYVTGTSMGGNGTWHLSSRHPEYFAASAPLASNPVIPSQWNPQFVSMPLWAFHGDKDPVCPLENEEAMFKALHEQGGTAKLSVLPDQGHDIAGVYKNPALYEWFLAHSRH
ncbi:MAG TPA: prolyl oligopeptidase family serine peptidase [Patescibacteria group bacterium]|nr:prolyl oligopeptidase family serine peptidase [Patescibacteria group bacterium]